MTCRTERRRSTDGKFLVAVLFERESPDADSPMIEVIYDVRFPQDPGAGILSDPARVLRLLSATRTDTRAPIELTHEEDNFCASMASEKSMEYNEF